MIRNIIFAAAGLSTVAASAVVNLNTTYKKTTTLTNSYSFNYGSSIAAGKMVVITSTMRAEAAINFLSVTDTAGNTYTQAVTGTQLNGLTYNSIYYCVLANAVTTGTTITVSASTGTYTNAQHSVVMVLDNITTFTGNKESKAVVTVNKITVSAGSPTGYGVGIALNSSGATTLTLSSVSSGWVTQYNSPTSLCGSWVHSYVIYNKGTNFALSVTSTFSVTANITGLIATFA